MKELVIIKRSNKDLEVVFDFLDRVTYKMIKISSEYRSDNDIVFIDYNDDAEYYVNIDKANRILDYCYSEYFFKVVLSGSDFYKKIKKISIDLDIEPSVFDLFFRSFFLSIKERFNSDLPVNNDIFDKKFHENVFYKTLYDAPIEAFENITRIDHDYFIQKADIIIDKIKELKLISFANKNITNDQRLEVYFKISCNTFKFYLINPLEGIEKGYESFSQVFEFLDLKMYLNNQDYLNVDLLTKLDKTIQMLVLISFKDESNFRFLNNHFGDNSYIKKLNLNRREREHNLIKNN